MMLRPLEFGSLEVHSEKESLSRNYLSFFSAFLNLLLSPTSYCLGSPADSNNNTQKFQISRKDLPVDEFFALAAVMASNTTHELALAPSSLTLVPVEIRIAIFEEALNGEWVGKLPNLLVALRGCEEMYVQAVEAFRRVNEEVLWESERGSSESMMQNPLMGIKTLVIE